MPDRTHTFTKGLRNETKPFGTRPVRLQLTEREQELVDYVLDTTVREVFRLIQTRRLDVCGHGAVAHRGGESPRMTGQVDKG